LVIGCYWLAGVGTSFESKSCPVVIHRFWICGDLGEPWLNQLARQGMQVMFSYIILGNWAACGMGQLVQDLEAHYASLLTLPN
jgi:hypothetical protein